MKVNKVAAFMRQPSTVLGFSALIGTLTAVLTGQLTWQNAVPAIAGACAAIALPDNPHAQIAIKDGAAAVVTTEQIVTNSLKETAVIGTAKTASMIALLLAGGFALSACTVPPSTQARSAVRLQNTYAFVLGTDVPKQGAGAAAAVIADKVARAAQ